MKLLIIHNKYQSFNIGGEDIVFINEVNALKETLGVENVFVYEVSNDDINKFKLFFEIYFSFKHYKKIKDIIKKHNIELVHIHNFFPLLTPSVFKASKKAGAKVVLTLHNYRLWCISGILYRDGFGICETCTPVKFSFAGVKNRCYRASFLQSFVAQAAFLFYRFSGIFENIDYFFVLTNFQKQKVLKLGLDGKKIILKPNFIELEQVQSSKKDGYIYVGRLEESKGILKLLDIWHNLDNRFVLTIIGTGLIEEELKEKYKSKNIIFKGKQSREHTLKLISEAKYIIHPSLLYETFGLTIIEAMSSGTPVIGLNIGTRPDFIEHKLNGFLCEIKDLKEIIEYSFNYKSYETMRLQSIETSKHYQKHYILNMQLNIYKTILRTNENNYHNRSME